MVVYELTELFPLVIMEINNPPHILIPNGLQRVDHLKDAASALFFSQ